MFKELSIKDIIECNDYCGGGYFRPKNPDGRLLHAPEVVKVLLARIAELEEYKSEQEKDFKRRIEFYDL